MTLVRDLIAPYTIDDLHVPVHDNSISRVVPKNGGHILKQIPGQFEDGGLATH
jgi:hypothetical protein